MAGSARRRRPPRIHVFVLPARRELAPGLNREAGLRLNYPLLTRQIEKHDGDLKDEFSFLGVEQDNVVVTAMKRAEKEDAVILRFYEWAGKESDVKLNLPAGAADASETDLMERPIGKLSLSNGTLDVRTKPYEIKTVRFHLSAKP